MPEALLLLGVALVAGLAALAPLRRPAELPGADDALEAAETRHRVALEALRDLDADRRAGLLDESSAATLIAEAETRAAATRAALEQTEGGSASSAAAARHRRLAVGAAGVIGLALVVGTVVPGTGLANGTVVNEALADAEASERERQDRIGELRAALASDPNDPETLSELADLHLAGGTGDDLARAAAALQLLVALQPDRADAYERIIGAYLRAGDHANARSALDAYEERSTADPVEVAFYAGLIALRGENDPGRALAAFERFLELAPDDPRADMIEALRDEAAAAD